MKIQFILLLLLPFCGCKKYLSAKTDKQLVVPSTLQDAQVLLDAYTAMNAFYSNAGPVADDDLYFTDAIYNSTGIQNQNNYIWFKDAVIDNEWGYMYSNIVSANLALEIVEQVTPDNSNISDWKRLKGSALFFRSYAFYHLAQYFAPPYDKASASQLPGIPLRLTSDVNAPDVRAGMEETYSRITGDLKVAAQLLPAVNFPVSRPSKASCYAVLARVYLIMEDYPQALLYADSALKINSTLLNYNSLDPNATDPFTRFNVEDLFHSGVVGTSALGVTNNRVDTMLFASYGLNDLRKSLFFKVNGTGAAAYYTFKGSYDGTTAGSLFNGPAVDEMYLIRSECFARTGNVVAALNDLDTLLVKRCKTGTFVPVAATSPDDALNKILVERRKELVGRGQRWFDLRRLNKDPRFAKTLVRKLNGQTYQLPPNDPRYTYYIPALVITISGMQQNTR
jgi:tetratricopeptide (TPR) repeat protein